MMRLPLACFVGALAVAAVAVEPVSAQQACGPRVALLIGNAAYPDNEKPLTEPVGNVRLMAEELRRQGYDVDVGENLSKESMQRSLSRFYAKVTPSAAAVFFFSGFGIQSDRQSFLVPVNAQIWSERDIRADGVSLDGILGEINTRGARTKVVIVDAARRNPFERRFRSIGSGGLAPVTGTERELILYSASPGAVFNEGNAERSVFVEELVKEIKNPTATAEEAFSRTRVSVSRASRLEQIPWISSSLVDDFSFASRNCGAAAARTSPAPSQNTAAAATSQTPTAQPPGRASTAASPPPAASASTLNQNTAAVDQKVARTPIELSSFRQPVGDAALVQEMRDRLYERNFDPGAGSGPAFTTAIRGFEQQAGLPQMGVPNEGLLRSLREADELKPWGAIVFAKSNNKWGMSWGLSSRKGAVNEARTRCGADQCTAELSFYGKGCGAFALSSDSWSITSRDTIDQARSAALEDCGKRGKFCRVIGATCANGSGRSN